MAIGARTEANRVEVTVTVTGDEVSVLPVAELLSVAIVVRV